ncbi:MAG: FAD-dependent oxidoreductase [Planctomycetales bacterium]|nr:FAD-dependent oxidoreductase [Planctomycetales bacterium]
MEQSYDVIVVGGGIHGVGVAQAVAADGYSVLVIEQTSLAAGTSSKSSKLIHGGLRYLESGEFSLVRESLRERELLLKLAPDLVRRSDFYIPVYPATKRRPGLLRAGLWAYSLMAGVRKEVRHQKVPKAEWESLDGLTTKSLQAVFKYPDAQTDDRALTAAVMRSAEAMGAELVCPAKFAKAVVAKDEVETTIDSGGTEWTVSCQVLVNAAGPWASRVAERISPKPPIVNVELVQGTHVELPGEVTRGCYYVESPTDQRAVFVMPWKGRTMLGTTELPFDRHPSESTPTEEEVRYLLEVYAHYFPNRSIEIVDKWAGLRVLPAAKGTAFRRSRETQLPADREGSPRVISIFGGKLTGYRATAQKVMKKIHRSLPIKKPIADTRKLTLTAE